jgi:DNA invertase Pin-like site-specific DNA recombinase
MGMGMLIGYARVSTGDQNHDLQMDALRTAGCERIWTETASGARTDRPQLAALLDVARAGDTLVIWRLDRLGRSLQHLIKVAEDLKQREIALRSLTEGIDTTTTAGRFVYSLLGALAQMEREVLIERTKAGLAAAVTRGRKGGRPRALDESKVRAAQAMLAAGTLSGAEIAKQLGVAPSTLYRTIPGGRRSLLDHAA